MQNLVIVESPTKAKTLSKFLGKDFLVESSYGHIRDLPKTKLGVDIEKNFQPTYVIPEKSKKIANTLKALSRKAKKIYFATDEDREGEAIAWHLSEILNTPEEKIQRIAFHEITREAVLEALQNPRSIDLNLVNAQQARRVLDRLVGYKLSPLLWKKIARGLSAGRVQSVAVRLIVERERAIQDFQPKEFWTIDAKFQKESSPFTARLAAIENKKLEKFSINHQREAEALVADIKNRHFSVTSVTKKRITKQPPAPFITSTLQQTANNRLGFSAKQTMFLAQQLYEGIEIGEKGSVGLITYMRTDSTQLSKKFTQAAESLIRKKWGDQYFEGEKQYRSKAKNVQEAHEAIRPTDVFFTPEMVKPYLNSKQYALYHLIWSRAVASQMACALIDQTSVEICDEKTKYLFRATGSTISFPGFLVVYPTQTKESFLPHLEKNQSLDLLSVTPNQHFTEPPPRYTEATLVKALEEKGIGRPSTYAPIIATIQERNYIVKEGKQLKPTEMGMLVNDLLVEHFPTIVDYDFTAHLENELDEIAAGKNDWRKIVRDFYIPFEQTLIQKTSELSKKEITESASNEICEKCSRPMVEKIGRFGRFLACSGFPECKNTKPLSTENDSKKEEPLDEDCPRCGKALVKKHGPYGRFIGCSGYPECAYIKKESQKEYADCPQCGKGKIVARRSRRGVFYACNQYPVCKKVSWSAPTGKKCPNCGDLLVYGKEHRIVCANRECKN